MVVLILVNAVNPDVHLFVSVFVEVEVDVLVLVEVLVDGDVEEASFMPLKSSERAALWVGIVGFICFVLGEVGDSNVGDGNDNGSKRFKKSFVCLLLAINST